MEVYHTIKASTEGFYKEKGSKFISYVRPAESIEQVREIVSQLKKKYHDARHHCFAYIIGHAGQQKIRANDDGEPGHSAGDPILGQIKSFGLTNVLVVVIRYFGGTKLGVPGLINAYRTAAQDALRKAEVYTIEIKSKFLLTYRYEVTNEVMRMVNGFNVEILSQEFTDTCRMTGKIEPDQYASLKSKLDLLGVIVRLL